MCRTASFVVAALLAAALIVMGQRLSRANEELTRLRAREAEVTGSVPGEPPVVPAPTASADMAAESPANMAAEWEQGVAPMDS